MDISSDVITAATTLAGLILVFLGSNLAAYASYAPSQQPAVQTYYRIRAWVALFGFALALLSGLFALLGKWQEWSFGAHYAPHVLIASFAIAIIVAVVAALEI